MTNRVRLAASLVGLLVAWGSFESCGDPKVANGTALLVTVNWSTPTADVFQLEFLAPNGGFPTTRKPDVVGSKLTLPATVRILLPNGPDAGGAILVRARAFGSSGKFLAVGNTTVTPVAGREVDVDVSLSAVDTTDGGVGDSGFVDAGKSDAGLDGGKMDAGHCPNCGSGCCFIGTNGVPTCQPGPLGKSLDGGASMLCGTPGDYCKVVETLLADRCDGPVPHCGANDQCPRGLRCDPVLAQCICDKESVCDGCCQGGGSVSTRCIPGGSLGSGQNANTCGAASQACAACSNMTGNTCNGGLGYFCTFNCDVACVGDSSKCCAGTSCQKADYPFCRGTSGGPQCNSCDKVRTDRCGMSATGCNCGASGPCRETEFCLRLQTGSVCATIPTASL